MVESEPSLVAEVNPDQLTTELDEIREQVTKIKQHQINDPDLRVDIDDVIQRVENYSLNIQPRR